MKPLVIYHNHCADGFTAAWIATVALGECELLPASYGDAPPDVTGRDVYVLDFSYPREVMLTMKGQAERLLVLDHHKTAEEALQGLHFCRFSANECGASMTWDHFEGTELPMLVQYVRDRDLWLWLLPDSRKISAFIRSFEFAVSTWDYLQRFLDTRPDEAASIGAGILRAQEQRVRIAAKSPRTVILGGHYVSVVNCTSDLSEVGDVLAAQTGAGATWRQNSRGQFQWSIRSDGRVDVSAIAKGFGGGGHHNAAGFVLDEYDHLSLIRVEQ